MKTFFCIILLIANFVLLVGMIVGITKEHSGFISMHSVSQLIIFTVLVILSIIFLLLDMVFLRKEIKKEDQSFLCKIIFFGFICVIIFFCFMAREVYLLGKVDEVIIFTISATSIYIFLRSGFLLTSEKYFKN